MMRTSAAVHAGDTLPADRASPVRWSSAKKLARRSPYMRCSVLVAASAPCIRGQQGRAGRPAPEFTVGHRARPWRRAARTWPPAAGRRGRHPHAAAKPKGRPRYQVFDRRKRSARPHHEGQRRPAARPPRPRPAFEREAEGVLVGHQQQHGQERPRRMALGSPRKSKLAPARWVLR